MNETNGGKAAAYQALRESEELHRATLENISDAVFLTDDQGAFTFICPNVNVIFGFVPEEVQAMGRIGALLGENLFDPAELAERGELQNIEREVTSKLGERRTLLVHLKRVAIQKSTVLYACRDVTDLKHAEEELRAARMDLAHASRLALVGELIASIGHEINQPLTAIFADSSSGLRLLEGGNGSIDRGELREVLADIHDQSRRAAEVISRVRALASKRPLEKHPLDVNEVVRTIVVQVRGEARRRRVSLRTELTPTLPAIDADRVCLQQVVLNLLLNAMDALDAPGTTYGATALGAMDAMAEAGGSDATTPRNLPETPRRVVVRTRRLDDGVQVAVSDTGPGIPADRLPKLFDAFFTTKRDGLGLGLSISRSIVEAHGGRIWAEDLGGRGATFHWTLPAL